MRPLISFLHYASPPTVGGVESTIAQHARVLCDMGYRVRVISGDGGPFDPRIESVVDPLFGSQQAEILALNGELAAGEVSPAFYAMVETIREHLGKALAGSDVCIVHNAHTLHKNLALTAALRAMLDEPDPIHFIAWAHDLAWTNPQYQPALHDGYPWDLLRTVWPRTPYVTVSEARQRELAALLDIMPEAIVNAPPGVDVPALLAWTPEMSGLEARLHLLDADCLLLLPARLTRRKNIPYALRVLTEARAYGERDVRLIVTGPPGPHNPANAAYLRELLDLRESLGLVDAAHFLYTLGESEEPFVPDDATVAALLRTCDALLMTSTQEGFGMPVLEAGLVGMPVFAADMPSVREVAGEDCYRFDPLVEAPEIVAQRLISALDSSPAARLRAKVRQTMRWETLVSERLVPLLKEA
jgi:glycosyltransferase involved in cell wall biosynthesis